MALDNKVIGGIGVVLLIIGILLMSLTGGRIAGALYVVQNIEAFSAFYEGTDFMGIVYGIIAGFFIGLALIVIGGLLILIKRIILNDFYAIMCILLGIMIGAYALETMTFIPVISFILLCCLLIPCSITHDAIEKKATKRYEKSLEHTNEDQINET